MDPVDQAGANVVGQLPDLPQQLGRARGDQRGDERGGAVPAVKRDGGGRLGVRPRRRSSPLPRRAGACRRSPGTTVTAPRSRSAGRGGAPAPTAATVPLDTSIHPGRNSSRPVSTVSAVINMARLRCPAIPAWSGRSRGSSRRAEAGRAAASSSSTVDVRVMLQDGRRPQRADRALDQLVHGFGLAASRSPPGSRAGPP